MNNSNCNESLLTLQETLENPRQSRSTKKLCYPCFYLILCFLGGLGIGYLNALPVPPTLWRRLIHTNFDNYCDFFDIRLQLVLASQHIVQLVAVMVSPYLISRVGLKLTLLGAVLVMMFGTGLLIWLPSTMVAIFAFVMLNLGIGVASWVFPLLLSRNSLEKFSILYNVGSWVGGSIPVIVVYLTITRQTLAWRVAYGGEGGLLLLIFLLSIFLTETPKSKLNKEILKAASFSSLLKRPSLPSLIITVVSSTITVFPKVGALQFYGPLLFSSANLSAQALYMPPLLISSIQILFRIISLIIVRFRGRKELLAVAALTKLTSEVNYFF
ncbi:hypothetical protein RND81_11G062900 [Saponaria officinalis]|uniref:Major facilitator superfamily (MFS) profile domain-containing protein n=1 Tax=Saponaria officinalis TaxID=3572 RepID=A0AAW1HIH6_SAPOF